MFAHRVAARSPASASGPGLRVAEELVDDGRQLALFWFLEVSSLIFIYMMLSYILSGHMIPLEWLKPWLSFVEYLPFRYLAYTPAAIMLGKVPASELPKELLVQDSWIIALWILNRWTSQRGVRR